MPPKLKQSAPGGLHPMEETPTGAVCEEAQPGGRTQTGEDCGGLSCGRDSLLEQRKNVRSPSFEAKGASEKTCDALTTPLIPCQAASSHSEGEGREFGSEVKPRKKVAGRKLFYDFCIPGIWTLQSI